MSTSPVIPPYALLYGAWYFGTILSTAFYGVACMQTFFYYVHYQNDRMRMKVFVAIVWMLNTIHEALCITGSYKYVMSGLVNPLAFLTGNPEMILQVVPSLLVSILSRGFFVYRIYIFIGQNILVPVIWVLLAIVQLVTAFYFIIKALYTANGTVQVINLSELSGEPYMTMATISLAVGAAVDILIAIFMTFLLIRKRSGVGFASTAHILQRLTVFSVNTGTWPAVLLLLTTIFLHVFPTNMVYFIPYIPLVLGSSTHNIDLDLFSTTPSFRFSAGASSGTDEQHREMKFSSPSRQGVWKTTEMSTFSDA
ncbi:hypothetical protein JVU11DRAFT_6667 [Chiua virens]|nr:hypothetical protein JVU11DRAFT_6667 [Chiua virens]